MTEQTEITWVFKEKEKGQVERKGLGVGGEKEGKKGWPYRRLLPPASGLRDFSLGFQIREDWNSALPKFEFSAKRRWSVSNPQLRLRPFSQVPASRTRGLEK